MGLEGHADRVLKEAGIEKGRFYYWDNGLKLELPTTRTKDEAAKKIMLVLDKSGEFGPTRHNKRTDKIEFGVFFDFFLGDIEEYRQYRNDFKHWLVN